MIPYGKIQAQHILAPQEPGHERLDSESKSDDGDQTAPAKLGSYAPLLAVGDSGNMAGHVLTLPVFLRAQQNDVNR